MCARTCVCALLILQDQFVLSIIFWNMVDVVGTILRENSLSLFQPQMITNSLSTKIGIIRPIPISKLAFGLSWACNFSACCPVRVHMCSCPVVSRRFSLQSFKTVDIILFLSPLPQWPLNFGVEYGAVWNTCYLWGWAVSSSLVSTRWTVVGLHVNHHLLQVETSQMMTERYLTYGYKNEGLEVVNTISI